MIRVLIADDQRLVRAGLSMILAAHPDIQVVGTAADGAETVTLCGQLEPDIVLMDVRMPGMDGPRPPDASWAVRPDGRRW